MPITRELLVLAIAAGAAHAAGATVAVYLENSEVAPFLVTAQAQAIASQIYAQIGVRLEWHIGAAPRGVEPGSPSAISMQVDTNTHSDFHPGALAYAQPYKQSGTRIHILYDRVSCSQSRNHPGAVLAHVMAHELGHVLEGSGLHAESGVMKAHWDTADFDRMRYQPLEFTAAHAALVRAGAGRIAAANSKVVFASAVSFR